MTVRRNLQKPVFTKPGGSEYSAAVTILETESFTKVIYKVEARDTDQRVGEVARDTNEWVIHMTKLHGR